MARNTVPGIRFVRSLGGVDEYLLVDNRLRILLVPDPTAPVAGCMVTYHVGSRNEATGYTGATHLLEHLMFKGSERFNRESGTHIEEFLEGKGAMINATTWYDRTNYYSVLPKDELPHAIAIEADRMRGARILESDRISEMPIVRNEFERGENLSIEALDKEIWSAAFIAHPYHHSTIGWRSDIEKVPIERLQQFYNDFYWPDNATVSIAGDFDTNAVLSLIKEEFGRHPKAPKPYPTLYTEEPLQQGQRRVIVKRAGVNMVGVAHKIPEATHADIPALMLLTSILAEGKSSRLHSSLIDTAKATSTFVSCSQFKDPSLFQTFVTLCPKSTHEAIEKIIAQEYRKIADKGVSAKELSRAKRLTRVGRARGRDGVFATLSWLNEELATGDWTRFVTLDDALAGVTAADVKRVAKTYLTDDDRSTVGWFINTAS